MFFIIVLLIKFISNDSFCLRTVDILVGILALVFLRHIRELHRNKAITTS